MKLLTCLSDLVILLTMSIYIVHDISWKVVYSGELCTLLPIKFCIWCIDNSLYIHSVAIFCSVCLRMPQHRGVQISENHNFAGTFIFPWKSSDVHIHMKKCTLE